MQMPSQTACYGLLLSYLKRGSRDPATMARGNGCPSPESSYLKVIAHLHPEGALLAYAHDLVKAKAYHVYL